MIKYLAPVLALGFASALVWYTYMAAHLKHPEQPPGYAAGFALVALIMPLAFGLLGAVIKKTTAKGPFDWTLFFLFVAGLSAFSLVGAYAEYKNARPDAGQPLETEIKQ